MIIPNGATHKHAKFYYKKTLDKWLLFGSEGWVESANTNDWLQANARPIFDRQDQTRQAIIDLAAKQCGLSGDSVRQLATVLAAEGYRKFEIVEEDV